MLHIIVPLLGPHQMPKGTVTSPRAPGAPVRAISVSAFVYSWWARCMDHPEPFADLPELQALIAHPHHLGRAAHRRRLHEIKGTAQG